MQHVPVLLSVVMDILKPEQGNVVLDVTLGLGGHAKEFLQRIGPDGTLIGLDADHENLAEAERRLADMDGSCDLRHANFRDIASLDLPKVDIVFADLGLSSPHIDEPERGFTFRADAPLDMRFDRSQGLSAAEWIAGSKQSDIEEALRRYGEMRQARGLARAIKELAPKTTGQLKGCVEEVCAWRAPSVLPQVFQSIRIMVNDEMGALESLLETAPDLLKPGGRLGIISYHSLEDRMVKQTFRTLTTTDKDPVTGQDVGQAPFELLTKKPVVPDDAEIEENPRSRSAKFRVIKRIASAP